ncbi:AbrB/MazE/SpoVT family DNA-binding domain-containing protein [Fructilactobacillus vespulae]|uniref:AbrB/MazE/SpoVT family DNA-binding domain-containing protein n=1 Tax=Fructilactobacillus vespulae TaxID=1249630 RepID=UPI0039B4C600
MKDSKYKLEVPQTVIDQLELKADDKLDLTVERNGIFIKKSSDPLETSFDVDYWWNIIPAIMTSIIFYLFFTIRGQYLINLTGSYSIATLTIILGSVSGLLLFTTFMIKRRDKSKDHEYRKLYWRSFPTIVIAFTVILIVALMGFFWAVGRLFLGISFGIYTATLLIFVFQLAINTVMINIANNITPTVLVDVFALTIIGGLVASMLTNGNLKWWQHNISFLGTNKAVDSWQFNVTFIFAALLMLALIDYLFVSLKPLKRPKVRTLILRILLTLLALDAMAVGLIANNRQIPWMHLWHNIFAWAMALDIVILIMGIKWLWPGISKSFLQISNTLGILIIITTFLFKGVHYFSLTAYEILASACAFSWIMLIFQYLLREINMGTQQFIVKLKQDE